LNCREIWQEQQEAFEKICEVFVYRVASNVDVQRS
jgi:hypothetical protein